MKTLIVATRNRHKLSEITTVLGEQYQYLTLADFPGAPEVAELRDTFEGNATLKAVELARWLAPSITELSFRVSGQTFIVAEDSGLEVDALGGAPGVYSARFAALDSGQTTNSPDAANNAKLLRLLIGVPMSKRTARFRCVIAVVSLAQAQAGQFDPVCFEGVCEGRIALEPRGTAGFGYDPLFIPAGFDQTFAQLGQAIKNQISHRANALAKLKSWLDEIPD
ncbi:MAG: RdgB/HAM1 family non-canonical purine NTP pyrophosphatase [Verrucomicrobiae bacterium]|nr:RdgB/HAM1 family non-canonical purine NTP pyrophosphatase [Verrucomicrobiae bacterium]MCX7721452.1 RdgB/HAM1 family non-canonical purine NTP pyrophosphatase [Verrucomicrobiae bacterium]MDW7979699.1 RdgB/HAM1 family non-canonical purine NTP pyrophosphatase [Verrucomicrobiales bacterium]